ncbi:hypothetical protein [Zhaonella formicivorans]|nr:hypothetical protein [Zhaonella formicivorans]
MWLSFKPVKNKEMVVRVAGNLAGKAVVEQVKDRWVLKIWLNGVRRLRR